MCGGDDGGACQPHDLHATCRYTPSNSTMGIPYSKQVNAAFEQVTPLVAAGFQVLQTTRNISVLLAAIQVLTVLLLGLIQATLLVVLITVNPDLQEERRAIVTPMMRWVAEWMIWWSRQKGPLIGAFWILVVGACVGAAVGWRWTTEDVVSKGEQQTAEEEQAMESQKA
ncbi:hypothetical protein ANO11243_084640 [Dothideomycetidae sp. 11243]|nr:hypothetical protein ANO11243_084640 [fungal sp. No.11243]